MKVIHRYVTVVESSANVSGMSSLSFCRAPVTVILLAICRSVEMEPIQLALEYCSADVDAKCISAMRLLDDSQKTNVITSLCGSKPLGDSYEGCMTLCGTFRDVRQVNDICHTNLRIRCKDISIDELDENPECACFLSRLRYAEYLENIIDLPDHLEDVSIEQLRDILNPPIDRPQCYLPQCHNESTFPQPTDRCDQISVCIQNIDISRIGELNVDELKILQECINDFIIDVPGPPPSPRPSPPPSPRPSPVPSPRPSDKVKDSKKITAWIGVVVFVIILILIIILIVVLVRRSPSQDHIPR